MFYHITVKHNLCFKIICDFCKVFISYRFIGQTLKSHVLFQSGLYNNLGDGYEKKLYSVGIMEQQARYFCANICFTGLICPPASTIAA